MQVLLQLAPLAAHHRAARGQTCLPAPRQRAPVCRSRPPQQTEGAAMPAGVASQARRRGVRLAHHVWPRQLRRRCGCHQSQGCRWRVAPLQCHFHHHHHHESERQTAPTPPVTVVVRHCLSAPASVPPVPWRLLMVLLVAAPACQTPLLAAWLQASPVVLVQLLPHPVACTEP